LESTQRTVEVEVYRCRADLFLFSIRIQLLHATKIQEENDDQRNNEHAVEFVFKLLPATPAEICWNDRAARFENKFDCVVIIAVVIIFLLDYFSIKNLDADGGKNCLA